MPLPKFDRYTDRARKVMRLVDEEARALNHDYIGTEHLLLAFIKEGSGVGVLLLKGLGVDLKKVRDEVRKLVARVPPRTVPSERLPWTPRAVRIIERAIEESRDLNHDFVGSEHLLLGMLRDPDGVAGSVLNLFGVRLEEMRAALVQLLGQAPGKPDPKLVEVSVETPFPRMVANWDAPEALPARSPQRSLASTLLMLLLLISVLANVILATLLWQATRAS